MNNCNSCRKKFCCINCDNHCSHIDEDEMAYYKQERALERCERDEYRKGCRRQNDSNY